MLKKLSRYYHTLKHLKPIQLRYQVWYRLRNKFFPIQYPEGLKAPKFQKLKLAPFPIQYTHYLGPNRFQFLNLERNFKDEIDWNYLGHGKLWAYHLNYFDFLHQTGMDWKKGIKLIDDFLKYPKSRAEGMEPYPTSLRCINWIKFLTIHNKYPIEVIDGLYAQFQLLNKSREYHLLGNHLLENGFSLLFGAVLFQDRDLSDSARMILKNELGEQILDDGGHFELSPMYHVILLQRALDGYNLLKNNEHDLQDIEIQLEKSIFKMVNWLSSIMFRNGDIPMLNDSTGGQSLEPKVVLDYAIDLGFIPKRIKLGDSGYRKIESGEFELIADVGEVGPGYQPGHAHSDTLNFVLYHKREPVIVDRGISTYEKNSIREEERGTASHNTVMIDEAEQTDVWDGFRVGMRAKPIIMEQSETILKVSHTGYDRLGTRHIREWRSQDDIIEIVDRVEGKKKEGVAYLHFHPNVELVQTQKGIFEIRNSILSIVNAISVDIEEYSYCFGFNNLQIAKRLKIMFNEELNTIITDENFIPH